MFLMYGELIFLYYFSDLNGAMGVAFAFCAATLLGSIVSCHLPTIWFGLGLVFGSFVGFTTAYFRLRNIEKNLDVHIFCNGNLLDRGPGKEQPSNIVFNRASLSSRDYDEKGRQ